MEEAEEAEERHDGGDFVEDQERDYVRDGRFAETGGVFLEAEGDAVEDAVCGAGR